MRSEVPPLHPSTFRKDINGLRAWAVVAVVLFHFGVPGFAGGFVGVDVFFVISGFLMTQIIVKGLEGGRFSIWRFYLARAKRIVPALLVLCAFLLVAGWFVLPAPDYRPLGTHALTSVLFASNIQYWREAGYFDTASHDKWLLHTWSLSVEWQFYLVLPLLLILVWRFWPGRRNAWRLLALVLLASLLFSVWLTARKPEAAFFLLPSRAWEMLAGGLIALNRGGNTSTSPPWFKRAIEGLGFAMIAFSIATANPSAWPGAHAALPVLGTVLVLLAASQTSMLTAPAVLQRLGDWSYSIYLWHWPVSVALTYLGWQGQTGPVLAGLLLSLMLGWASYRWAEPLGRKHLSNLRTLHALSAVAVATLVIALPALGVRQWQGVPGRLSPQVEALAAGAQDSNPGRAVSHTMGGTDFKKAVYGGSDIRAIVLGDSHASTVVTAVQAALTESGQGVLAMSYTSCPTVFGIRQPRQDLHCAAFNEWALAQMADVQATVPVILVSRASAYLYGNAYGANKPQPIVYFDDDQSTSDEGNALTVQEYAKRLTASACRIATTCPVYQLRPFPEMPADVPRTLARAAQLGRPLDMGMPITVYHQRHALVWAAQDKAWADCGAHVLDPLPYLCENGVCAAADGTVPRYYDDNHLSEAGNRNLVPLFKRVVGAMSS